MNHLIGRRTLLRAGATGIAVTGIAGLLPAWAQSVSPGLGTGTTLTGPDINLTIARSPYVIDGTARPAITLNGQLPAPLLRLREGERVRIHVDNQLDEDSSIHWHGLLVPFQMDGVPGVSFPGIPPHSRFTYEFPLIQSGTYWYHSHSGLQELLGHYGPLVIDPAGTDPVQQEREHVLLLSDFSDMAPELVFHRLKQEPGYFNRNRNTLLGREGRGMRAADRAMFAQMRMDPADIADVTGSTFAYLVNGHGPSEPWTGLFRAGERVRLRIINGSGQTIFNVRIPGLALTIVAADGQYVRAVEVDEFQIGNGETYDVIVRPVEERAFSVIAESIDRSGMAVATLAPRAGMRGAVPPLRERPTLTMADMGMGAMNHGDHGAAPAPVGMDHAAMGHGAMDHAAMGHAPPAPPPMDHGDMPMRDGSRVAFPLNPGIDMIAPMPVDRTDYPGLGLDSVPHRVLTYRMLASLTPQRDRRAPTRTIEVHLTGNMERFMWSMDGQRLSENPEPYRFARDERVRIRIVNDTMMTHPMHLHGHFFELVNGQAAHQPSKHTVMLMPGGLVDLDLTADAPGDWAFHCHMLLHMLAGMMRIVTVRPLDGGAA